MANKWDLNTWVKIGATSGTLTNVGGAISNGKKRFLTYIRVERTNPIPDTVATALSVHVASNASAATPTSAVVSAGRLFAIKFPQVSTATTTTNPVLFDDVAKEVPANPSMEHPLVSVSGSGWLSIWTSGAPCNIFAAYYDE